MLVTLTSSSFPSATIRRVFFFLFNIHSSDACT